MNDCQVVSGAFHPFLYLKHWEVCVYRISTFSIRRSSRLSECCIHCSRSARDHPNKSLPMGLGMRPLYPERT